MGTAGHMPLLHELSHAVAVKFLMEISKKILTKFTGLFLFLTIHAFWQFVVFSILFGNLSYLTFFAIFNETKAVA